MSEARDDVVNIEVDPVANVDELIERYGFHRAQIVWSADGQTPYTVTEVIRDAWFRGGRARE